MIIDEIAQPDVPVRRPLLDRRLDLGRLNLELVAYGLLFVVSIVIHLWQLGYMAMAHDESIHAWMSWKFFTGRGDFQCAGQRSHATYCYDPVYHGPTLYFLTAISYFLFGVGDATARLPQALSGIALIPACYLLRPLLGKRATLLAATLVTLSPSMLYFSRYARHDALILLWTLLMAAGLFRWIRNGSPSSLVLAAASLALAWATHELVFILIFIFGSFLLFRLFWEWRSWLFMVLLAAGLNAALLVAIGTAVTAADTQPHRILERLLGPAMLAGAGALMSLLLARSWPREALLTGRLRAMWATRSNADATRPRTVTGMLPPALWAALGTFLVVFGLLFSTFMAWPRGFLDGWYQGIAYWWFSQHDYARGGQPWYYYLMLLPIYELMALIFAIGATVALSLGRGRVVAEQSTRDGRADSGDGYPVYSGDPATADVEQDERSHRSAVYALPVQEQLPRRDAPDLFVPFLAYWWVLSLIAFSWAGEKMPWLLIHTALPVTLLAAWALSKLIDGVPWRHAAERRGWAVPLLIGAALVLAGVAVYYLSGAGSTVSALQDRLRSLPALLLLGAAIFGLMTFAGSLGTRVVLRLAALTVAGLLLLYGVRAAVQVVYLHPDTPVEPLIYTQTAPDVPVIVGQIRRTAISQTRNERSEDDPTGGLSMKVVIDPELAWPFQWYLRDFR
ncbi:MAG TPA: flippase activity-associated protein Agl23, partial [Herpetosiphonaceae bacterium]|nr:flippase activity-associated protein Agl23 [Herpetosiphonaceae bacterium]